MPRYRLDLAYDGTEYSGWQIQPNAKTVQATVEAALSIWCKTPIEVVGCGRTDAGVHASQYVLHFDAPGTAMHEQALYHINQILPQSIVLNKMLVVADDFHARYDANLRSYTYHLAWQKNPFNQLYCYTHPSFKALDIEALNTAAQSLMDYDDFSTFCKTGSDVTNKICKLHYVAWKKTTDGIDFHISANRFLRGMVRLIVGMCIRVAQGKTSLDELHKAMKNQQSLPKPWSVPAKGLFLSEIIYSE